MIVDCWVPRVIAHPISITVSYQLPSKFIPQTTQAYWSMIRVLLCLCVPNYLIINLTFTYYFHFMDRKESFRKVLLQRGRFKTFAPSVTPRRSKQRRRYLHYCTQLILCKNHKRDRITLMWSFIQWQCSNKNINILRKKQIPDSLWRLVSWLFGTHSNVLLFVCIFNDLHIYPFVFSFRISKISKILRKEVLELYNYIIYTHK